MTTQATPPQPTGATIHLGGDAWTFPDLEHQLVDRDQITRYPGNPRRGDQEAITSSVRDHGLYAGCVVQRSTGHIVVGNHRDAAVDQLGGTRVAVTYIDVDDTRAAQIVARDNLTSDKGGYDDRELADLLVALRDQDQLPGSGYLNEELSGLLAKLDDREPVAGIDDAPPPPVDPVTREGDVWVLGRHRVMCGSGLDADHLATLLDGAKPGLVYTDPPYGIAIVNASGKVGHAVGTPVGFGKSSSNGPVVHTRKYEPVIGDETTDTAVAAHALATRLWPRALQVWWGANHYAADAALPNSSCWLVWDKETGQNTFADAELAWTNAKGAVRLFAHQWSGLLRASERGARVHPTQKPVALALWAFDLMLKGKTKGAVILDQFGGSGSALIAAEQSGASARVMELSPAYCDVMCRRYQQQTGSTPVRDGVPVDFTAA